MEICLSPGTEESSSKWPLPMDSHCDVLAYCWQRMTSKQSSLLWGFGKNISKIKEMEIIPFTCHTIAALPPASVCKKHQVLSNMTSRSHHPLSISPNPTLLPCLFAPGKAGWTWTAHIDSLLLQLLFLWNMVGCAVCPALVTWGHVAVSSPQGFWATWFAIFARQ